MVRLIDRPMPRPASLVELNGSNRRGAACGETPVPVAGQDYVRVSYDAAPPPALDPAKIYLDFDKDVVGGKVRAGRFLKSGSLIRGMSIPTPPRDDQGHWHTETNEFYFIMEGKLDFQLEGQAPFIVEQGDVVYVPHGRYHRNNYTPPRPAP